MSKTINLYCRETPGLKLGPGEKGDIIFLQGYATFDEDDFPDWQTWVAHPGTPAIEVLDTGEAATFAGLDEFQCPDCEKPPFKSSKALNGHRLSHRPAGAPVSKPTRKAPATS
jgi:hypothetical protein